MLQGSRNWKETKAGNDGKAKAREKEVNAAAERPDIHAECNRRNFVG